VYWAMHKLWTRENLQGINMGSKYKCHNI